MLERFLKLENCIRKALIDLEFKTVITDREFDTISSIVTCLEPVKLSVGALSQPGAYLLSADTITSFRIGCATLDIYLEKELKF